jgi:catechol 2,3-dioxygenase-like lactoylglutathione lyase family enzyme
LAHTGVCVPDVEAAVAWYRDVLGLTVLSPPYLMGARRSAATWASSLSATVSLAPLPQQPPVQMPGDPGCPF